MNLFRLVQIAVLDAARRRFRGYGDYDGLFAVFLITQVRRKYMMKTFAIKAIDCKISPKISFPMQRESIKTKQIQILHDY
jgi:hypothetical protein